MSIVSGSSFSGFKAPMSIANKRTMSTRDGIDIPLSYYYKQVFIYPNEVIIKTPQELQTYVQGDKQVHFRYIQIVDKQFVDQDASQVVFNIIRVKSINQRNNYDYSGIQSQVIGYLTYDTNNKYMKGECQLFEIDGRLDIKIFFEKYDIQQNQWVPYIQDNTNSLQKSNIYIDCEVQYDYNSNV